MIDSFITYESNPNGLPSPTYSTKNIDEMFKYQFDPEAFGFLSDQTFPQLEEEVPKPSYFDQFSHQGSAYSTNPSIKHSPEHTPEDADQDDDGYLPAEVPKMAQKGIKKHYEPILDNGKVYRYEESASEYRKARKRIQNRESATRVRNRKKTQVEELDEQIEQLQKDKAELKVQNAALLTENNLLKQQISFLEKVVSRNGPEDMIDPDFLPLESSRTENSDSILHLMNKSDGDEEAQNIGCKYFRAPPSHKFKKHVALLGVFTLLLCVYGLLPRSENTSVQLFARTRYLFSSTNSLVVSVKPDVDAPQDGFNPQQMFTGLKNDGDGGWSIMSYLWIIELIAVVCYVVYFIYVAASTYKRCLPQMKKTNIVHNSLLP